MTRYGSSVTTMRLVLIPLVMLSLGALLGFRNDQLVTLMAGFAAPTAVASAPMAQAMGGNGTLASEIVAVTTIGSIGTIFCFIYFLSRLGLI